MATYLPQLIGYWKPRSWQIDMQSQLASLSSLKINRKWSTSVHETTYEAEKLTLHSLRMTWADPLSLPDVPRSDRALLSTQVLPMLQRLYSAAILFFTLPCFLFALQLILG
jgi:hypothetical protein